MDVEVLEVEAEVDHPCEVVGVEHEAVDEVDSVTVEVDEVVVEEDSSQEAHQGADEVDSVIEEADEVDEEDTRLLIHVQYRLALCSNAGADHDTTNPYTSNPDSEQAHFRQRRIASCKSSAGPPRSGQLKFASECNPPSFSTSSTSKPATLAAEAKSIIGP